MATSMPWGRAPVRKPSSWAAPLATTDAVTTPEDAVEFSAPATALGLSGPPGRPRRRNVAVVTPCGTAAAINVCRSDPPSGLPIVPRPGN